MVSRQSFNYKLQLEKEQCGFHPQGLSKEGCYWMSVHTARAADEITALTHGSWKSTT